MSSPTTVLTRTTQNSRSDAPSLICVERQEGCLEGRSQQDILSVRFDPRRRDRASRKSSSAKATAGSAASSSHGQAIWKCDLTKRSRALRDGGSAQYIVATPVLWENRIYIAPGQEIEHSAVPAASIALIRPRLAMLAVSYDGPRRKAESELWGDLAHLGPFRMESAAQREKKNLFELREGTCSAARRRAPFDGTVYAPLLATSFASTPSQANPTGSTT